STEFAMSSLGLYVAHPETLAGAPPEAGCCWNCGYDARGLIEPRCPECGSAFEPGGVRSGEWTTRRTEGLQVCILTLLGPCLLLFAISALAFEKMVLAGLLGILSLPLLVLGGLGTAIWALDKLHLPRRFDRLSASPRAALRILGAALPVIAMITILPALV